MDKYRNELKYLISENEMRIIVNELGTFLSVDENAVEGRYTISSLYFDSIDDDAFYDVDDGIDLKTKYRIRIYDGSDQIIRLERKNKINKMTSKRSCILKKDDANTLIRGLYPRDISMQDVVLKELTYHIMADGFKPVIIVEYERIPYIYKIGNVRITLDMNISSSDDISHFLKGTKRKRPILPVGKYLLEVKFDEYLPEHIFNCLNDLNLQQISFSKYYLCRKYNFNGVLL